MTEKTFDVPEVLAALEAAVEKRGEDYVYARPAVPYGKVERCLYVHDRESDSPTPGCLVGQVHYDLMGELVPEELEGEGASTAFGESGPFDAAALELLDIAQGIQDGAGTWGEALAAAKEKAAEV